MTKIRSMLVDQSIERVTAAVPLREHRPILGVQIHHVEDEGDSCKRWLDREPRHPGATGDDDVWA
jgi:hypothetical protein